MSARHGHLTGWVVLGYEPDGTFEDVVGFAPVHRPDAVEMAEQARYTAKVMGWPKVYAVGRVVLDEDPS